MWKQTLYPNLDDNPNKPLYVWANGGILTDWYGWCLAVVAASFGAKGSSYSAKPPGNLAQTNITVRIYQKESGHRYGMKEVIMVML